MIRRELPLTTTASPAIGLSQTSGGGFSFVLAPAAADLVLEFELRCSMFLLFPSWKGFFYAAIGCVEMLSALMAIAHMNPSSSRPTAVITFL